MSSKKEAGESLQKLKSYLNRDRHAVDLIGQVERFIGDLRRERAELKTRLDSLAVASELATTAIDKAALLKAKLKAENQAIKNENESLKVSVKKAVNEANEIRRHYEGEQVLVSKDCPAKEAVMFSLFARVRAMMPKAPPGGRIGKGLIEAEAAEIISGHSDPEYMKLGMFVAFCCLVEGSVRINGRSALGGKYKSQTASNKQSARRKLVAWMRPWYGTEKNYQEKLRDYVERAEFDTAVQKCDDLKARGKDVGDYGINHVAF